MKYIFHLAAMLLVTTLFWSCEPTEKETTTRYKYKYKTVEGDPLGTKIYTLDNGLKIYMSVNRDEPRVVTQIAVRTGSKQDPADATGLAHYLEHMLFKGTSNYGTKDWEAESVLLDQISDLYEEHRNTTDPAQRKAIYAKIDSISGAAAQLAIANEYDKMIGSLGAQGTNAYTWYEQTVYINDIPSNELEKWAMVEGERFRELVLRLFHTELEAVYEEFNRALDSDFRLSYYAMMEELFKNHPYGTQTTIGTSEHLKNPSMEKIHEYFAARYLPNNMAIILSGDIDPDEAVDVIKRYFGDYEPGEIPEFAFEEEAPITEPIVREVSGVEPEFVTIAYRLPGIHSEEALKLRVMDAILSNGKAGLIDLNLEKRQKVLRASSSPTSFTDYSIFTLSGNPRDGQTLDEVAELLLEQMELIKSGDFDDWMVEAVIRDMKLNELRASESNWARASKMTNSFVYHQEWQDVVNEFNRMEQITKDDIVAFANQWFGENYVQINKVMGENTAVKVEKPQITPIEIDRESKSNFYVQWDSIESRRIKPVFVDYQRDINRATLDNGLEMYHVQNKNNELFSLYYILDMGSDHDLEMALAISYLPYLGTSQHSSEDLQKEFFKLGLNFDVFSSRDRVYVTLSGLNESLREGMELFEEILADVQPDEEALENMISDVLKSRQDNLRRKGRVMSALVEYASYGENSPMRNFLSEEALRSLDAGSLTEKIKQLTSYEHRVFYYGPMETNKAKALIAEMHPIADQLLPYPEPVEFTALAVENDKVFFTDFDMVQSEMSLVTRGSVFNKELLPAASLFNQYFGSGLSSIVFQEIRESKALAYSAYAFFSTPQRADEHHFVRAYVGAQVDKLPEACNAMLDLMNDLPRSDVQFESARDAALKQIETNRISRSNIFWSYESARKLGLDYDRRKPLYDALQTISFDDLQTFFDANIKGNAYNYCVIGNRKLVDHDVLKELGKYRELSLEELFGYEAKSSPRKPIGRPAMQ
ncbi:MAG: insulinase family protein [Cryomorphaceae bacterium]|nr:MAG: insulinase family protein [Cryomorphaceae bacterium]